MGERAGREREAEEEEGTASLSSFFSLSFQLSSFFLLPSFLNAYYSFFSLFFLHGVENLRRAGK